MKQRFAARKIYAAPVMATLLLISGAVVTSLTTAADSLYSEREVLEWYVGDRAISIRTKSFLLNRILTIWIWSTRFVWETIVRADEELVILRGSLDYYCPFETFPVTRRPRSLIVTPHNQHRHSMDSEAFGSSDVSKISQTGAKLSRSCSAPSLIDLATRFVARKASFRPRLRPNSVVGVLDGAAPLEQARSPRQTLLIRASHGAIDQPTTIPLLLPGSSPKGPRKTLCKPEQANR